MPTAHLSFALPDTRAPAQLRGLFAALAQVLAHQPVQWGAVQRTPLPDENFGEPMAYQAELDGGVATLSETVACNDGNPRDGWGYSMTIVLRVHGIAAVVTGENAAWEPRCNALHLRLDHLLRGDFAALRAAAAGVLDGATDQAFHLGWAPETVEALAQIGDADEARALCQAALAGTKVGDWGRDALLTWQARDTGAVGDLERQLREAPADLQGWERAADGRVAAFPAARVARIAAVLSPFDGRAQHRAADVGGEPALLQAAGAWFGHPFWPSAANAADWPVAPAAGQWWRLGHDRNDGAEFADLPSRLATALHGYRMGSDWQSVTGELVPRTADGCLCMPSRLARFADTAGADADLPRVCIKLAVNHRDPADWDLPRRQLFDKPFAASQAWHWLNGPRAGDWLVVVTHFAPDRAGSSTRCRGWAATCTGDAAFGGRARCALEEALGLPWVACGVGECFPHLGQEICGRPPRAQP